MNFLLCSHAYEYCFRTAHSLKRNPYNPLWSEMEVIPLRPLRSRMSIKSSFPLFPFSYMLSSIRNTCLSVGWLVTLLCAEKIFIFFWRHFQMKTTCIFSKLPVIPPGIIWALFARTNLYFSNMETRIWSNGWMYFHAVVHWILDVVLI